jgi:two-component system CheB/CheR fusion protein
LNTVNSEYQEKVEELYESNNDLNNLIRSIDIGTIFLDKHLCIRKFTPAITREINLLSQDIGRPLSDFSSPFIQNLYQDAQIVLNQGEKIERTVRADDGKWFLLNILPYLDEREQIGGVVMTVVDISREKKGSQEMEIRNQYLNNLIDINPLATIVTDKNGIVKKFNQAAEKILGKPARHFINHLIDQSDITFTDTNDHPFTSENNPIQLVLKNKQPLQEYLIKAKLSDQSSVDLSVYANPSFNSDNEVDSIVFVFKEQC